MVPEFTIGQNDLLEELNATLDDSVDTDFTLVGATVYFNMRSVQTGVTKINHASATIVDGVTRSVKYVWALGDTDTAGEFIGHFEVVFADNRPQTFPNAVNGGIFIHITPNIA